SVESWNEGVRKNQVLSRESAQIRATHPGTYVAFGERTQGRSKHQQRPTGKRATDGAPGAVWTYGWYIDSQPGHQNAVSTCATSRVITGVPNERSVRLQITFSSLSSSHVTPQPNNC